MNIEEEKSETTGQDQAAEGEGGIMGMVGGMLGGGAGDLLKNIPPEMVEKAKDAVVGEVEKRVGMDLDGDGVKGG